MSAEEGGGEGEGAWPGRDRRQGPRVVIDMWVEEIGDSSQVYRRAANLSRRGIYLEQTIPIAVGSRVRLRFTLPGESAPTAVVGEVASVTTDAVLGMGVKFVEIDPDAQARIDAYLARAAGGETPA